MSIQTTLADGNDRPRPPQPRAAEGRPGFFRMYKPGQGYWTRLGTAIGAGVIILFITWQVYQFLPVIVGSGNRPVQFAIAGVFVLIASLFTWWLVNGPNRAQFLIDTDSEMKKVNWSTRKELIGSTRVVVFFMVLTALLLFILDTQYHAFFHRLTVWKVPFDPIAGLITGGLLVMLIAFAGATLLRGSGPKLRTGGLILLITSGLITAAWIIFALRHVFI